MHMLVLVGGMSFSNKFGDWLLALQVRLAEKVCSSSWCSWKNTPFAGCFLEKGVIKHSKFNAALVWAKFGCYSTLKPKVQPLFCCHQLCPWGWLLPRGSPGSSPCTHFLWQWIIEVQAFPAHPANQGCSVLFGQAAALSSAVYLWVLNYRASCQDPHLAGVCGTSLSKTHVKFRALQNAVLNPVFSLLFYPMRCSSL